MFGKILTALDNSKYSDWGAEAALAIGGVFMSEITGCHVYAAKLHESRFMDMETGLPQEYQSEAVLARQRTIHESLIAKGLGIISDSYLDKFEALAAAKGTGNIKRKNREGKNYSELIAEATEGGYGLVVMGGLGMGTVESSLLGGVCERVARHISADMLVLKTPSFDDRILVGIDGSPCSYAALMAAIGLKKVFGGEVEAVAAFDPYFHQVAFRNIAGALSEEAAKVFKFKEQEKLHDEIIDKGLAKLYQAHLDTAYKVAKARGVEIKTTLLAGKSFNEILKAVHERKASFAVVGRHGLHKAAIPLMGNTAENVLRLAPANVFVASGEFKIEDKSSQGGITLEWTPSAIARLDKIPVFARGMAVKAIEDFASEKGHREITDEIVDEAKKRFGM
ncbi:MAG: universal stress protein [Deltaproteobacteria bacterium]|nr:universal stress protein [Deltaproteobacteria bacterium]